MREMVEQKSDAVGVWKQNYFDKRRLHVQKRFMQ